MNNKCVYTLVDEDEIVRYVGQGTLKRPYQLQHRDPMYADYLKTGKIVIVKENLSFHEAFILENELINSHKSTIINKVSSSKHNILLYDEVKEDFELSSMSPSGIISKKNRFTCAGKLVTKIGQPIGTLGKVKQGKPFLPYWNVRFKASVVKVHRLVWVLYNKVDLVDTTLVINHIDGNSTNNAPSNLEICSFYENCKRKTKQANKSTLRIGVKLDTLDNLNYRATVSSKSGKRLSKRFAVGLHGLLPAFAKACQWREDKIKELIANNDYY